MKVKYNPEYPPVREHPTDAGIDLRSVENGWVMAHHRACFHTGVYIELPSNTCGLLVSKSGLNIKHGITSTGLIDEGYSGEIIVSLINNSNHDYMVHKGDKITQLVVIPCVYASIDPVDQISGGERGESGFGSTGK